jgi:hypothetical protein
MDKAIEQLGPLNRAAIDVFEAGARATTDLQRSLARVAIEPAGSLLNVSADMTRDVAAAYASCARWLLDA